MSLIKLMKHNVNKNPNKIPLQTNGPPDINMRNPANAVTGVPVWQGGLEALATELGWISACGECKMKEKKRRMVLHCSEVIYL